MTSLPVPNTEVQPERIAMYVAMTLMYLVLCWLIDRRTRLIGTSFILWGILAVILSVGYGLIGIPDMATPSTTLSKIGFLLVLGGMISNLIVVRPAPPQSGTPYHV